MAAHLGGAVRDTEVDQRRCPYGNWLGVGKRLLFERHTFAHAEAGSAGAMGLPFVADEAFVEVYVAIDQPRQHQASAEIMCFTGHDLGLGMASRSDDAAIANGDIDGAPVG